MHKKNTLKMPARIPIKIPLTMLGKTFTKMLQNDTKIVLGNSHKMLVKMPTTLTFKMFAKISTKALAKLPENNQKLVPRNAN
jgi:hypothetical protein